VVCGAVLTSTHVGTVVPDSTRPSVFTSSTPSWKTRDSSRCPWVVCRDFASSATLACQNALIRILGVKPSDMDADECPSWRAGPALGVRTTRTGRGRRYGENDYRKVVSTHVLSHCITPSPRCTSAQAHTTAQGKLTK